MSPSIYVVEPQALFVPELYRIVAAAGGHVARFAESLDVEEIVSLRTDYALVDLDYAEISVLDGLAFFRSVAPDVRVIVLTEERDFAMLERFRIAGASTVLAKSMSADEVSDALRAAFERDAASPRRIDVIKSDSVDAAARRSARGINGAA
jgi:DNA-binding NarL/FixJ family response regulator